MEIYKIYPVPAADASTAFQIELDPRAIAAAEELENSGAQGTEREEILQKHLGTDYEKGYQGTAWGLHGISEGLTPGTLGGLFGSTRRIPRPMRRTRNLRPQPNGQR